MLGENPGVWKGSKADLEELSRVWGDRKEFKGWGCCGSRALFGAGVFEMKLGRVGGPVSPPSFLCPPENRLLPTELRHEALALQKELEFDFEAPAGEWDPQTGGR